ncbi:kinase suppressor of Ras 2-like [Dendronephthya gigantea]|uniref:kinase suppressor of Ras 2-like n=1 Tax=Dendronephthya gigantea TaxID=151771 RepID=UPI0010696586|nr:kinase suppressor of Ras 2-like [Dendronephthya gigantea]
MEVELKSHGFTKVLLCRKRCNHCLKIIRFFGLRCRNCRIKCHKSCSLTTSQNCYPCSSRHTRKSKSSFLKRSFGGVKNERRLNEQNMDAMRVVPTLKWKFGPQHAYSVKNMRDSSRLNTGNANLIQSPINLTNYVCGREFHISAEDVCASYDNLEQSWQRSVLNRSRLLYNSTQGSSLHPQSALSSGYSSVNQSCASSAGTGSQRSRSPTPDQFETLREECGLRGRFGSQVQVGYNEERGEELLVCGGGDRHPSNSPVRGSPVFFLESDDESSGEWDGNERLESLKIRPGLKKSLKDLEIRFSDLEIDTKVGVGPNGPVYRGRWHGDVMIHTRRASQREEVEEFRKEIFLLSMIRHENVMLFMGACLEPPNLAVVVSLRKCLSIHNHLHCQESRWSMATRLNIMLQVAQGMSYLHAKCITVPCLRTMNIFLESKVKLCINDYTCLHHQVKREGYSSVPQGHLTYLAPEVISKVNVDLVSGRIMDTTIRTRKMDIYAYGTVMYEILTDKWPFANLCPETVIWMIGKGLPHSLSKVKGPDSVKDLIKTCWSHDPIQRPGFVHITHVLKQRNLPPSCISRRHSISEPENMQYHCPMKRI